MLDIKDIAASQAWESNAAFARLGSSSRGLNAADASRRMREYGPNEIRGKRKLHPLEIFVSKFKNPILIVLLFAAAVSYVLGTKFSAYVIIVMVFLSAAIDFVNTYKSARAAEMLKEKVKVRVAAQRDGERKELPIADLVPGDIVFLSAGNIIPADCYVFEEKDLFVNEAALTGESVPVEKNRGSQGESRIVYMGTSVVSGVGTALVVLTGSRTRYGQIAAKMTQGEPESAFEKELKKFSFFIFVTTIILVGAILFLNILTSGKDYMETFLFAVAIAVGIAPEMLPMILTANLSKGALAMEKKGVIVKKLSAIHDFGSIDVLCTDKTGTLTEDKITLVKCLDLGGSDSADVLRWGFASSTFGSGVQSAMDNAIRAKRDEVSVAGWEKSDEIPFDYERRRGSVVVRVAQSEQDVLVTKGAPEEVIDICVTYGKEEFPMDEAAKQRAHALYESLSSEGYRVLGLALKKEPRKDSGTYGKADEKEMTLLGFLAFLDPPKKSAADTLKKMRSHGVEIKIITGDNHLVTKRIAQELGLPVSGMFTGQEVEAMGDTELSRAVLSANVFTRVTPEQKERIINAVRKNGHVVGYLGDGVNDILSLQAADVGISVDNAVDMAKDTADIILLQKGLEQIIQGVVEGRRTFANVFKYLMMALSSNFGNMVSMPVASLFLPFLPMAPSQILLNNFLYDMSQLSIPLDKVDAEFLKKPKKFDIAFLRSFMMIFGPISSIFDIATFYILFSVWHLPQALFQAGWFMESIASQTLVVMSIRSRTFFMKSRPGLALAVSCVAVVVVAWVIPFSSLGSVFGFGKMAPSHLAGLAAIVVSYIAVVEIVKGIFYKKFGNLIEK